MLRIIYIISNPTLLLFKFIKFSIVGFSGLLVDFGITWICKEKFKLQKYLANSLGFITATVTNFYLNRIWTFSNNNPAIVFQFGKFALISIIGLIFNNLILFVLNEYFKIKFYLAKLIAIGMVVFWNFFANYYFTFQ